MSERGIRLFFQLIDRNLLFDKDEKIFFMVVSAMYPVLLKTDLSKEYSSLKQSEIEKDILFTK